MSQAVKTSDKAVEIILDFEKHDWHFLTQPGALRRIIMNIFGNAQKYTDKGFIQISLLAEDPVKARLRGAKGMSPGKGAISLTIKDSGRAYQTNTSNVGYILHLRKTIASLPALALDSPSCKSLIRWETSDLVND